MGLLKCAVSSLLVKSKKNIVCNNCFNISRRPPWKVMFFGTDDFSLFSLRALCDEYRRGILLNKLEVVTLVKDKPNAVKIFSEQEKLPLHKWPPDLCYGQFDVGLVVSFGHLIPQYIIEKFEYGMLNVHASLLPRWRGAAPIIYAIANGDTETGVTIMKISSEKFDVGEIVCQESTKLSADIKLIELYQKLAVMGATNLIKTLVSLPYSLKYARPQPTEGVTYAPKVNHKFASVRWNTMTSEQIYNRARALDGVFHLQTMWKGVPVKLLNVCRDNYVNKTKGTCKPGFILYDKTNDLLKVLCADLQFITVKTVRIIGKKNMTAKDFNNGYIKKEPPDCRYFE